MWYRGTFFKYATATILILLIIFLINQISFLLNPIISFFASLFIPIVIAGVFYYALRPIVRYLEKMALPKSVAILIVYLVLIILITIFSAYVVPILIQQINAFTNLSSNKIQIVKETTRNIVNVLNPTAYTIQELQNVFAGYLYKINELISSNILDAITNIAKFAIVLVTTPFILYYFLKDDDLMYHSLVRTIPSKYQANADVVLTDMDTTLSSFITGQLMVAFSIGVLLLIGYLLIGLENAVILAIFAMIFVMIPILGSIIAIIPAMLIGLTDSPFMALKVLIVMVIAQTIEGNLISPQILSYRLHLHPLTVILILLASGFLYGIVGLFLATPIYAVAKILIIDLYQFYDDIPKSQKTLISKS